ncbi:DAK2 domain-containing protein [Ureaplasma ceti]|uniref:Fatty acid kinase catalytic subunit FakA n=1 Tax=Ureaplasma ceti TaxID=3119530 RepID=A0ABP9UDD9_9BACT
MITLQQFIDMINGGAKVLDIEYDYINDLNVFPVPDGDTGSNMKTTVNGAIEAVSNAKITDFKHLADVFARGLLMNARGNSGVIFSQIIRGFVSNFTPSMKEITPAILKESLQLAKDKAYNAVANPIEGTILTVIRCMAENANSEENETVEDNITLMQRVVEAGNIALDNTPNMLKELKEVGVVDSGGYGLMCFFKGMLAVLENNLNEVVKKCQEHVKDKSVNLDDDSFKFFDNTREEEGFGYCSEIIMTIGSNINPNLETKKAPFVLEAFRKELSRIGNSLVCVQDGDLVKVHVHTMKPYRLLQIGQKYGEFEKVKFENMTNQYYAKQEKFASQTDTAKKVKPVVSAAKVKKLKEGISLIATVPTKKIARLYKNNYGLSTTITTEENAPSIQDFIDALYKAECKSAFIVTDDSNLVMAATEAANQVAKDIMVKVLPAKNTFESLVIVTTFDKDASYKTNYKDMTKILKKTISGVVSTSIRDVNYSHIQVKTGEKIGIVDKKIMVSDTNELKVLKDTLDILIKKAKGSDNLDICYLIYGANASLSTIRQFEKYASENYGLYCEVQNGGQKVYDYYLGVQ